MAPKINTNIRDYIDYNIINNNIVNNNPHFHYIRIDRYTIRYNGVIYRLASRVAEELGRNELELSGTWINDEFGHSYIAP